MGGSRAIMTDTERDRLAGVTDVDKIKVYQAKSRVRRRIEEELTLDVEVLAENHTELFELLRDTVCADETGSEPEMASDDRVEEAGIDEVANRSAESTEADTAEPAPTPRDVVVEVARMWEEDAHFENRIEAAVEVLSHAVKAGEPISKRSDIVETVIERYPVDGHDKRNYWRQTLEPVLSEVGEYSWGADAYRVDNL